MPHRCLPTLAAGLMLLGCGTAAPASPTAAPTATPPTAGPTASATPSGTPTAGPTQTATVGPTVAPTATPQPTPPGAQVITSEDGLLTIVIPEGALTEPVDISLTALAPPDFPPELGDLADRVAGYKIEPEGLEFLVPVTVTHTLLLPVGGDPMHDGVPIPRLAVRSTAGDWTWLEGQLYTADLETMTFIVSGTTTHTSSIWEFFDWLFSFFLYLEEMGVRVGDDFTINSGLFADPMPYHPSVGEVQPFSEDGTLINPGKTQFFGSDPFFEQKFKCLKPGTTTAGVDYTGLFPDSRLDGLGLPEGRTEFSLRGLFNCRE